MKQLQVARYATLFLGALAIILGIVFKGQNVAYMVGLAFAIAASGNFPALLLSIIWRGFTTNGAVASILVGTISSLILIYLSPTIQIDLLKNTSALFPLKNPGLITIPLSFLVAIVVSLSSKDSQSSRKFQEVEELIHLGKIESTFSEPEKL
jgi:cation/acetate symporter